MTRGPRTGRPPSGRVGAATRPPGDDAEGPHQHPVHHVRPAPVGLPVLLRPPAPGDPEHRPARRPRGAVHPRLLPGAAVRSVPGQHPHRPLHVLARRDGQRGPAQAGGADPGRLHAGSRSLSGAGRQDGGDRRPCRAGPRLGVDPDTGVGRAIVNGGFEPFEKLEGLYPDPILPPRLGYNDYLRRQGYAGDNPWELYANSATGEGRAARERLEHATRRPAGAGGGSAFGDRVHHRPGHRVHRADPGRPALVPAPELHQAALALSCPRPLPRALHPRSRGAGGARRQRARGPASGLSSLHAAGLQRELLPRRGPRAGDPHLHGPRQAGRRPPRPAVPLPGGARPDGADPDRLHQRPRRLSGRPLAGGRKTSSTNARPGSR